MTIFEKLSRTIAIGSCGRCCGEHKPLCDKCEESTLLANGLDLKHKKDIHGLNKNDLTNKIRLLLNK